MRRVLNRWLKDAYDQALAWVLARTGKQALRKDDEALPKLDELLEELEELLIESVTIGAAEASSIVGLNFTDPPRAVVEWARERAAEMVGMKRLPDGSFIPNPDARWQISEALRTDISDLVNRAIKDGLSNQEIAAALKPTFGPWRAETIARTETGMAYNEATATVYEDAGIEHSDVFDGDGCIPAGHDDGAEAPDGTVGIVQDDRLANGQVWTIEQMRAHRLGHPNCVRSFTPYIGTIAVAA